MSTLTTLDRLTFGRRIGTQGDTVTGAHWAQFEDTIVSQSFPDGYTVTFATGGWRDVETDTPLQEPSIILDIIHDGSDKAKAAVLYIAQMYKAQFKQDAVMRTTAPVAVEFV